MMTAAISEPTIEPRTTLTPSSSAPDAPAKDNSLMPCTANGRSRAITKTPISPPISPSTAPAINELRTSGSSSP